MSPAVRPDAHPAPVETERLLLPRLAHAHTGDLAKIYEDVAVARFIGGPHLTSDATRAQINTFEAIWHRRGYGQSAVIEKSTGQMIGRVGLHDWPAWDAVELGYVIRADRQGQGFAREASRAWIDWAEHELDSDALIAVIQPENLASIRLATQLGFQHGRPDVTPKGVHVQIYRRELESRRRHGPGSRDDTSG
ncbi:GNAT family N-acetyltransferase [Sanguibacter antarcticus]|uniref:RimJ/RimL family protein N-acetyltransferase n=1 Tax=Sanguibacter antarcticus TaxID=372484 RepID=A0A2A9E841_9MICO|nr:GNAT family N-acetyltransferase [Sanguibacter antarcticus]PFG34816.1 RimJ/RimL family protein N-acetyltransferase [Sanguibacter antarcticus]